MKNLNWVISQLEIFSKILLKLTRNGNDRIEVVNGGNPLL